MASRTLASAATEAIVSLRSRQQALLAAAVATCALGSIGTLSAHAAPVKGCGGYEPGRGFVRGDPDGAGVYNITSRIVSCATARTLVYRYYVRYSDYCTNVSRCSIRGWTCRTRSLGIEYADTRCTRLAGRVVRFQHGA